MSKGWFSILLLTLFCCSLGEVEQLSTSKINGASLVSPPRKIPEERFQALNEINSNWVAVIPYAFSRGHRPKIFFDNKSQWWGERTDGSCELITCAQRHDLKVLLKPHVWVMGDGWPGEYDLETEADWREWEITYSNYIMTFAQIADSMEVDMLAIGTEFRIPAVEREAYWRSLIQRVREVYHGKVTYAANWDNYDKVKFWDQLDYIGVDAYFPIDNGDVPSVKELEQGWKPLYEDLKSFSSKYNKPMLFTEYGYQSVNGAAGEHWNIDKSHQSINMQTQANAYQALFNTFWGESWFAGGFFWKWHLTEDHGGPGNADFTPQGKVAATVIQEHYGKFKD